MTGTENSGERQRAFDLLDTKEVTREGLRVAVEMLARAKINASVYSSRLELATTEDEAEDLQRKQKSLDEQAAFASSVLEMALGIGTDPGLLDTAVNEEIARLQAGSETPQE